MKNNLFYFLKTVKCYLRQGQKFRLKAAFQHMQKLKPPCHVNNEAPLLLLHYLHYYDLQNGHITRTNSGKELILYNNSRFSAEEKNNFDLEVERKNT